MRPIAFHALAIAPLALAAVPAQADEISLRVAYSAADLTTADGLTQLKDRVAAAADEACAPAREWVLSGTVSDCTATLMRKALDEIERLRAEAGAP